MSVEIDNREKLVDVKYQPYVKRKYFFSLAEVKFYDLLREILGDKYILFSKVRIADIIEPKYKNGQLSHFYKISSKHVDFLVCSKNPVTPKIIVELDDSSHDSEDRIARDKFVDEAFANAGIPIVHIRVKHEYNREEVVKQILEAYVTKFVVKYEDDNNNPGCGGSLSLIVIFLAIVGFLIK